MTRKVIVPIAVFLAVPLLSWAQAPLVGQAVRHHRVDLSWSRLEGNKRTVLESGHFTVREGGTAGSWGFQPRDGADCRANVWVRRFRGQLEVEIEAESLTDPRDSKGEWLPRDILRVATAAAIREGERARLDFHLAGDPTHRYSFEVRVKELPEGGD